MAKCKDPCDPDDPCEVCEPWWDAMIERGLFDPDERRFTPEGERLTRADFLGQFDLDKYLKGD